MNMHECKNRILAFLPVMKELELMGYNPVRYMFGSGEPTIEEIENGYIALMRAKIKYPAWRKVMDKYISSLMKGKNK